MEKKNGFIMAEAGDEMFVVVANHRSGALGSNTVMAIVGTFTERRLADSAASSYGTDYGKNGEAAYGQVVSCDIYSTCLDQHGTCPLVGKWLCREVPASVVRPEESSAFVEGPYTKETLEALPDYAVVKGHLDIGRKEIDALSLLFWETFEVDHDVEVACEKTGLEVLAMHPEIDQEAYKPGQDAVDDFDAALSFLAQGGALCKVPDEEGSPHYRLLAVSTPEMQNIRGNTV